MANGVVKSVVVANGLVQNATGGLVLPTDCDPSGLGSLAALTSGKIAAGILTNYLTGLVLSNDATLPNSVLDIAAGTARDSTDAYNLYLSASTRKTLQSSGSWAAGSGGNGLDTGAVAASSTYHVYVIGSSTGTSVDVIFSLSATAPSYPTGYTLSRRIGSIMTNSSSQIRGFVQHGDEFWWAVPVGESYSPVVNPGTAAVTRALTVPSGINVKAMVGVLASATTTTDIPGSIYLSDLATTDTAPGVSAFQAEAYYGGTPSTFQFAGTAQVWTNTAAQIRTRIQISGSSTNIYYETLGWVDYRGRQ